MDGASTPELAATARILANESRAAMLLALLDGRAWTATELADDAGISRPATTEHLNRMLDAGLIAEVRQGRHRYVRPAGTHVADVVESVAALSGRVRPPAPTLRAHGADRALREARTCYRHLAGRLGVDICDGMRRRAFIDEGWELTASGRDWLTSSGIVLPEPRGRPLVRPCLDWTERREHLAGVLADRLLAFMREHGWVVPGPGRRAVRLTDAGRHALSAVL